jgi:hypothetical protein
VAIAAAVAVALYLFVPPAVVPADAPATEFSAERAMEDIRMIADEPHPMGSQEHEEVADYIVSRLEGLGLSPQIQETTSLRYDEEQARDQVHAGRVKNVLARIPGTDNTGEAVLLVSHYDSMPTTPAAADGGVSTATLLETVRAIQAGPPPKNDLILYMGDADVNGVLGPIAFHEHPWSKDARVSFAFEGIGSYGPSALVYDGQGAEGSDPTPDVSPAQVVEAGEYPSAQNGWWLDEALSALPRPLVILPLNDSPLAPAASPELANLILGTDGAGLGFGQFRGGDAYHTVLDNPERLDPRSLQHQGDNALSLTRHFGNLPLDQAEQQAKPTLVAFNVFPGQVISYPSTWALPMALSVSILLAAILVLRLLRGRLKLGGLLLGVFLFVLSLLGTVAVTTVGWKLGAALNPAYQVWMGRGYYGTNWRLLFLASLTIGFIAALYLLARRFVRTTQAGEGVAAGALVLLAVLSILTSMGVPSFSYLFIWPALAGLTVLGFGVLAPARARDLWPQATILAITAFVPVVLFVPPIYSLYTTLAVPFAGALLPVPPAAVAFVLLAMMLGALLPHLFFLGGRRLWVIPAAFTVLALVFLAGELISTRFDADQPRPDYVQYRLDADTAEAKWISDTNPPDAWTKQFFEGGYERGEEDFAPVYYFGQQFEVIRTPAPEMDLLAPRLEVLDDAASEGTRELRLRLTSPRGAPYAHLQMTNMPAEWVRASVDGENVDVSDIPAQSRRSFAMMFYNLPESGIEIKLAVRSTEPIDATLTDYSNGLPDVPGMEVEPRPPEFMPAPYDFRDPTAVNKTFEL